MIKVEFFKEKCIGNASCIACSTSFKFNKAEKKAELVGGKNVNDVYIAEVPADKKDEVVAAAEVCPVNAIQISEHGKILVGSDVKQNRTQEIKAAYDDLKEFTMDKKGYFLIRVNREKKRVEVGHCKERNEVDVMFYGDTALELYMTIIKKGLVTELGHAAYLGREIEKACLALKYHLNYVQDDPLELK